MATKKTPDQILDGAADILEKHGWVTESCYDSTTGGYCALGALAKATFPKLSNDKVEDRAFVLNNESDRYEDGTKANPAHREAVFFLAKRLDPKTPILTNSVVYEFNDSLHDGIKRDYDWESGSPELTITIDEKVRLKSSRKVVQKLRNAAKAYRKQQEKLAV